jgi:hypothetical protein
MLFVWAIKGAVDVLRVWAAKGAVAATAAAAGATERALLRWQ